MVKDSIPRRRSQRCGFSPHSGRTSQEVRGSRFSSPIPAHRRGLASPGGSQCLHSRKRDPTLLESEGCQCPRGSGGYLVLWRAPGITDPPGCINANPLLLGGCFLTNLTSLSAPTCGTPHFLQHAGNRIDIADRNDEIYHAVALVGWNCRATIPGAPRRAIFFVFASASSADDPTRDPFPAAADVQWLAFVIYSGDFVPRECRG